MDRGVWSKCPPEIRALILEKCDRDTLHRLAYTNPMFYDQASNILWERVRITAQELLEFCPGFGSFWNDTHILPINPRFLNRQQGKMLNFLENNAFRNRPSRRSAGFPMICDQPATLPRLRVKDLAIDYEDQQVVTLMLRQVSSKIIIAGISKMLALFPNLQSLSLDGPIQPEHIATISQLHRLRELLLRARFEWARPGIGHLSGFDSVLNLRALTRCTQLRSLAICRLAPGEARGLASAIIKLPRLTTLYVLAGPPADHNDSRHRFARLPTDVSPIVQFLEAVCFNSNTNEGVTLPSTLRNLTLQDLYRPCRPRDPGLILKCLASCSKLEFLGLQLWGIVPLREFFVVAHFPLLKGLCLGGCRHLLDDDDWASLGLNVRAPRSASCNPEPTGLKEFLLRHRETLRGMMFIQIRVPRRFAQCSMLVFDQDAMVCFYDPKFPAGNRDRRKNQMVWDLHRWYRCRIRGGCCMEVGSNCAVTISHMEAQGWQAWIPKPLPV